MPNSSLTRGFTTSRSMRDQRLANDFILAIHGQLAVLVTISFKNAAMFDPYIWLA